jgi:hypothetical protein
MNQNTLNTAANYNYNTFLVYLMCRVLILSIVSCCPKNVYWPL